ncbi:hypothetical protein [cyanobacterium endosymbiont of Rhopalodia gibberula]|nr:hypothetical protein [cyanobacterium endosymbiont of Rhopalodia gibberula]
MTTKIIVLAELVPIDNLFNRNCLADIDLNLLKQSHKTLMSKR